MLRSTASNAAGDSVFPGPPGKSVSPEKQTPPQTRERPPGVWPGVWRTATRSAPTSSVSPPARVRSTSRRNRPTVSPGSVIRPLSSAKVRARSQRSCLCSRATTRATRFQPASENSYQNAA